MPFHHYLCVLACASVCFSHYRLCRCWDHPALCYGAAWHGDMPPAPISWCWTSCPPASSPYPAPDQHQEVRALSEATIACTDKHTRTHTRIKQLNTQHNALFLNTCTQLLTVLGTFSNHTAPFRFYTFQHFVSSLLPLPYLLLFVLWHRMQTSQKSSSKISKCHQKSKRLKTKSLKDCLRKANKTNN